VEAQICRVDVAMTDQFQQVERVVRDLSIDAPQIDRIPTTILVRAVPCEKKVGDAARLASRQPALASLSAAPRLPHSSGSGNVIMVELSSTESPRNIRRVRPVTSIEGW
jgi:hypothetical protein